MDNTCDIYLWDLSLGPLTIIKFLSGNLIGQRIFNKL